MIKTLAVIGGVVYVAAAPAPIDEVKPVEAESERRELFPLFAAGAKNGVRAQAAHRAHTGVKMSLADSIKTPIKAIEQLALNDDLNTVVSSGDMCTRRRAMARAAGLAAGLSLAAVNMPAFAAETKSVKMGSDSGQLVFVPDEIKVCAGDSVTWVNNKGGPHNVVFDEEAVPSGVDAEGISMDDQLGDAGATYTVKLEKAGTYGYFCEPHRGAGMTATVVVG
jgi:plastocyanin